MRKWLLAYTYLQCQKVLGSIPLLSSGVALLSISGDMRISL